MDGDKDGWVSVWDVVKNLRSEKQAADLRTLTDIPELFWLNLSDDDCIEIFKKVGFDPDTLIKGEKKFTVKEWRAFLANAKQLIGLEEQERILESLEPPPPPPVIDPRLEIAWELFDNGDMEPHAEVAWEDLEGRAQSGEPVRARSRFRGSAGQISWLPCQILKYDPDTSMFQIVWSDTSKTKWVTRLNLIFDSESESKFRSCVATAHAKSSMKVRA